jgi:hypothetical protein
MDAATSSSLRRDNNALAQSNVISPAHRTEKGNMINFGIIAASAKTRTPADSDRENVVETESADIY